jgi:putative ABC transport system permease protein
MVTRDLLHSLRWIRSHPLFTISVTAILALGVGANTAVFSIVDAVLLRALPYESSPGLVRIQPTSTKRPTIGISAADYLSSLDVSASGPGDLFVKTVPYFRDMVTLTGAGEPGQFFALRTSGRLFPLLGVRANLGRALAEADDQLNAASVAVISGRLWQHQFHSDPAVIGRAITVSGDLYTVAGVMPPEFDFPEPQVQLWLSLHLTPASSGSLLILGRLKPGVSSARAQAALQPIAHRLEEQGVAQQNRLLGLQFDVSPWSDSIPRENRLTLIFIMAAVGLVLLIACADVGGLLLSRAVERQREIAIRASLGAGIWQVVRQLLAESLVLAGLGSVAGTAVARAILQLLTAQLAALPAGLPHVQRIALNGRVLLFNTAVCLLLACLCSLAPVIFARRIDLQAVLRGGHGSRPKGSARLFSTLIAAQTGFAFLLLVGSGLMLHSLVRLQQADHGFRPEHVLTLRVPVGTATQPGVKGKYDTKPRQIAYYREILDRLQRVPGVGSVAVVNNLPLSGSRTSLASGLGSLVAGRTISPQYFTAMGIPLIAGRFFSDDDTENSPAVVIVNQFLARQLYPDRDPVGQPLHGTGPDGGPIIVGVVKDSSQANYDDPVKGEEYLPYRQFIFGAFLSTFVVRTSGDPLALAAALRQEVWAVDPDQPVLKIETMEDVVADSIWRPRFSAWVFSVLGGLALLLACAGIYSVIAYTATLRSREVGIRVALGAAPLRVVALILREAMLPLTLGLAISLIAALLLSRLLTGLLYETGSTDPAAYLGAGAVLMLVGVLASLHPAVSAAAADPVRALRIE